MHFIRDSKEFKIMTNPIVMMEIVLFQYVINYIDMITENCIEIITQKMIYFLYFEN